MKIGEGPPEKHTIHKHYTDEINDGIILLRGKEGRCLVVLLVSLVTVGSLNGISIDQTFSSSHSIKYIQRPRALIMALCLLSSLRKT